MRIGDQVCPEPQLLHLNYRIPLDQVKSIVEREHYALNLYFDMCGEERGYTLVIRYYWDGETWSHYWFGQYEMGDFEEIVSVEEADRREQAYLDNEGKLDEFYRPRVIRGIEKEIEAALIRRWEALCELVTPHVTH